MAYTPNEWGVGNLITASKMNKIERQLVANTSDLDDIRNGVTVPTYEEFENLVNNTVHINEAQTLTTAQKDQARDNIEAASEEDIASLKSATDHINDQLRKKGDDYDWSELNPGTVGWAQGYYGDDGTINSSSVRCMRTGVFWTPSDDCSGFVIEAPDGYYVSVVEYDQNGVFIKKIGYQGLPNRMDGVTADVTVQHETGHKYYFSVGVFEDCTQYLTSEFVATIKLNEYVEYGVEKIDELNAELNAEISVINNALDDINDALEAQNVFDWKSIGSTSYPYGWGLGYYSSTTGTINRASQKYIRTDRFYVPNVNIKKYIITAPEGYYISVAKYDSSGNWIGSAGTTIPFDNMVMVNQVEVLPQNNEKYRFVVGVFNGSDAGEHLTETFINSIRLVEYRSVFDEIDEQIGDVENAVVKLDNNIDEISEHTKNLFDWQNANLFDGAFASRSSGGYNIASGSNGMLWFEATPGETYVISKIQSTRFRYGTTATKPESGVNLITYSLGSDESTAKSFTMPDDAHYVALMYCSSDEPLSRDEILKSIQIEIGSIASDYVPYITAVDYKARQTIANSVGGNLFAMFDNLTCIGDSLTYSEVFTGEVAHRQAKRTYPQVLAALSGNTSENLGRMGYSVSDWWDECNSLMAQKQNQLFIIYLGTNNGMTDTIDTDCPVGGSIDDYADNNTGCYGKILLKVLELGGRAVLVHIYGGGGETGVDGVNAIIDKFGQRFGFPVLSNEKLLDECYHKWPNGQGVNNLHYNDLGYATFAGRMIGKINALPPEDLIKLQPSV